MTADFTVVAAVDLGPISRGVLEAAVKVARGREGRCLALHVVEGLSGDEDVGPLLPSLRRWIAKVRQQAAGSLEELLEQLPPLDRQLVEPCLVEGRAFSQVIREARRREAACIVVGAPPPDWRLGSVAERIVRKSPIPVLVVRRPPAAGYQNVLVGVDFSANSERSLAWGSELCGADGRVTACHVLDVGGLPADDAVVAARHARHAQLVEWLAARRLQTRVTPRVEIGNPRRILLRLAAAEADLLAVGCRGRGRIAHLLLGSVAEAAARGAACDVLVVEEERRGFALP